MEIKCNNGSFDMLYSERVEIENETEHFLPDYMPGIQRIIKSDMTVKISDKKIDGNALNLYGDIEYSVLYISENSGLIKRFMFSEPFDKTTDIKTQSMNTENAKTEIFTKIIPGTVIIKSDGQRGFMARSRFSVLSEIFEISEEHCDNDEKVSDCEVEFLRKNHVAATMLRNDGESIDISEEVLIDSDMPEISDIVLIDSYCCVKNTTHSDDCVTVSGEITANILYEAQTQETSDYISFQKVIPFKTEVPLECVDSNWSVFSECEIENLNAGITEDGNGENRILALDIKCNLSVVAFKNCECIVFTDMYSTNCSVVPETKNIRTYSLITEYKSPIVHEERLRTDLKGFADIVTSTLKLSFSSPELSESGLYISARGNLCILGVKENGDFETQNIPIALKIPVEVQNEHIYSRKIRWFNFTSLCRHECELAGGEVVIKVCINRNLAAFSEENTTIITGYEKSDNQPSNKSCGFTVYYPRNGESIWDVAKCHSVSYERIKAENEISGDTFDGTSSVILH